MEIRFQPALLQEVIDSFVEKTEREGDPTYYKEFHEHADPIYEKFTLEDREAEFKKLYQYLFGIWGFSDIVRDSFHEYSLLREKVGIVLVKGVLKEDQEGVDILRKWGSVEKGLAQEFEAKGMKGVGIKLIPRRFYDPALTRYCRHELMHISDMIDPQFGYDPDTKVGLNPGEETLILQRYRVLWSLSVDSRLVTAGKEPMLSKEDRFKEFRSWYRKIPPPQLKSVFEGLWQTSYFTHSELIEMAGDTLRVMDRAVDVEAARSRRLKIRSCSCRVSRARCAGFPPIRGLKIWERKWNRTCSTSSVRITQDGTWISEPVIGALRCTSCVPTASCKADSENNRRFGAL